MAAWDGMGPDREKGHRKLIMGYEHIGQHESDPRTEEPVPFKAATAQRTPIDAPGCMKDVDDGALKRKAMENYERFYGLPSGSCKIDQVVDSSAGLEGRLEFTGPGIRYEPSPISNSRPIREVKEERMIRKARKKLDQLMTKNGQQELLKMIEERDHCPGSNGLSVMTKRSQSTNSNALSAVGQGEWIKIDITFDTGACDSVMPAKGPREGIAILPSEMSRSEEDYEVANSAPLPNLGERHLAIWTEGASQPRHMCMQVANVHKPLLALSRCADLGYESRFGKHADALVDTDSGEVIPLHRVGNLYMMRAWIRAAPHPEPSFGGPR